MDFKLGQNKKYLQSTKLTLYINIESSEKMSDVYAIYWHHRAIQIVIFTHIVRFLMR